MAKWYWRQWRPFDHVEAYARLWQQWGPIFMLLWAVFWIAGGILFLGDYLRDSSKGWIAYAGVTFGMSAFFIAAAHTASLASSVVDRLTELNKKIDELSKSPVE